MDEPRNPQSPADPERQGVEGGDRDVSTDVAPPSTGAPADTSEGGMRGEDKRRGGMGGEG